MNSQLELAAVKEVQNLQAQVDPRSDSLADVPSSNIFCALISGRHSSNSDAYISHLVTPLQNEMNDTFCMQFFDASQRVFHYTSNPSDTECVVNA